MSLTGQELLVGFSKFIGDYVSSTTTSAGGAGGNTLIDTYLSRFADDKLIDWYLRPTGATNQYAVRRISDFTGSTGTCTVSPVFAAQTASTQAYELHRYDPADKFQALDDARLAVSPYLYILRTIDTITADGISNSFSIPSTIRVGPFQVIEEEPLAADADWNFLSNPVGNSTTGWTASNATQSIVTRDGSDNLIPKYDNAAMKLVVSASTAATVTQAVSSMSPVTAATAAGREVTFGSWVYCRTANKVQLDIVTDAGTLASSSQHGGSGWELLTATGVVASNNATTLSVRFATDNDSSPVVFYWNRAWFYFGSADMIKNIYHGAKAATVRRDDTTQKFYLDWIPQRGRQLRIIGRDTLSAISGSATASMEVDEESAQLLYAEAARIFFAKRGINTSSFPELAAKLGVVEQMRMGWVKKASYPHPVSKQITGPWHG